MGKNKKQKAVAGRQTEEGWRATALELSLSAEDLDLLDRVLTVVPILRIIAAATNRGEKRPRDRTPVRRPQ